MDLQEVERILGQLKDFQRNTVEYVFRRMYLDERPTKRFLVADEVGLGKTMVARGIIARALHHLQDKVDRIDVVYVCSNSTIAEQNINRLNVLGQDQVALATRLTMLPVQLGRLAGNRVNFVSFTPGTTFDLKSRGGKKEERAVLLRLLREAFPARSKSLYHLLQCTAGRDGWDWTVTQSREPIDAAIARRFRARLLADRSTAERLEDACDRFQRYRQRVPDGDSELRYDLIGDLRHLLAQVCVEALEPDLVILDEFQRFKDLLSGDGPAAELAQSLFNYQSEHGDDVRVLLLSATPYRMLSLNHEGEDHYADFVQTLQFLLDDSSEVAAAEVALKEYRTALYGVGTRDDEVLRAARDGIESRLRKVISRTERVGATVKQDAMLIEPPMPARLAPQDLAQALLADRVATAVGARDPIEYWKSAPYLLSFMKGYELRHRLHQMQEDPPLELLATLHERRKDLLRRSQFQHYQPLNPANARLRALIDDTVDAGQWKLLWIPPSLPYLQPGGAYAETPDTTKALVFSAWNLVPDAIAALCSYEAERRMLADSGDRPMYSELYKKRRPLLRFAADKEGRLTGMPALALLYPCVALATAIDPLDLALKSGAEDGPLPIVTARGIVADKVEKLLRATGLYEDVAEGAEDQRWYWAALALLDHPFATPIERWCQRSDGWLSIDAAREDDKESRFAQHVVEFTEALAGRLELGRPPADLVAVLTDFALGSPAICALRALRRQAPEALPDDPRLLQGAAQVASGFRTLFNFPETMGLLRGEEDTAYWQLVLRHCIEGNLQAVLDEHAHVLRESLGLFGMPFGVVVEKISSAVRDAVSVHTSSLKVDEVRVRKGVKRLQTKEFRVRTRLAIRYGDLRAEDESALQRAGSVQQAFNSPFRPFVLPSTSIGQEGLDFHPYCHRVYHWNLPANPVDFEQREGRVHRYKGHAVRKNVASRFGLSGLRGVWLGEADPWDVLFGLAVDERDASQSDLVPFWIYENGPARVERRVPILPYSREQTQLRRLKDRLAMYRLVFGQPRQEDLLAHLEQRAANGESIADLAQWRICLAPRPTETGEPRLGPDRRTDSLGAGDARFSVSSG